MRYLMTLKVNRRMYASTDPAELIAFALMLEVFGCIKVGPVVEAEVPLQRII